MVEQISHPGRRQECCAALLTGQRLQLLRPKVESKLSFCNSLVGGDERSSTKRFFLIPVREKHTACNVMARDSSQSKAFLVVYVLTLLTCFFAPSF